jgi:squalene-hopene/tetraprenyl-beta-curcumene cyclase
VPFIERTGADWIATKDCLSCHHTSFMVWSLNVAKQHGVPIDDAKLGKWTSWATDWRHHVVEASRAKAVHDDTLRANSDAVAQLLLFGAAANARANQPQWFADSAVQLAKAQQPDGSWKPGGQLPSQKRPQRETQEVSTMWALLALAGSDITDDSRSAALKNAAAWLGNETSGKSTEWWATRLMLERRVGSATKADQLRADLLKRQKPDGGWGWLCDEESDALGTGIALYALGAERLPRTDPPIAKAQRFLVQTQKEDGSWPVRGTKQNKKDSIQPTSTYLGTCWAVVGLCETLDEPQLK